MRTAPRSALVAAVAVFALLAVKAPEASALCALGEGPCACASTIIKEYGKYIKANGKVLEKCNDAVVKAGNGVSAPGGNVSACDPDLKVAAAATKLRAKINGKCQDAGVLPGAVAWPGT